MTNSSPIQTMSCARSHSCTCCKQAVLHITSDYGYGSQGAGGVIPPDADLDFEVELLKIGSKSAAGGDGSCCVVL